MKTDILARINLQLLCKGNTVFGAISIRRDPCWNFSDGQLMRIIIVIGRKQLGGLIELDKQ